MLSITSISFPNRFNILPDGVVSKNPNGDRNMTNNNSECSKLLLRIQPMAQNICANNIKMAEIYLKTDYGSLLYQEETFLIID